MINHRGRGHIYVVTKNSGYPHNCFHRKLFWNVYHIKVLLCQEWKCYHISLTRGLRKSVNPKRKGLSCTQPLLAHNWRVDQCLLTPRFTAPLIPWGASAPGGKMRKQLLQDHNFLNNSPIFIIESSTLIYLLFKKHCIQYISISKIVLDLVKGTWHHNFMVGCGSLLWANTCSLWSGINLDQGQGVYSGRSDVVGSSQVRLCHACIIDVMKCWLSYITVKIHLHRCLWGIKYKTWNIKTISNNIQLIAVQTCSITECLNMMPL